MRKLLLFTFLIVFVLTAYFLYARSTREKLISPKQSVSSASVDNTVSPQEEYLFVPFWTLDSDLLSSSYNLIYFGITADKEGIDTENDDYKNIQNFISYKNDKPSYLTVRMLNTDTNLAILKNPKTQGKIINESISAARENGFSGIILDLETQGLPFQGLIDNISKFNNLFAEKVHSKNLTYGVLMFGDNFYKVRPYDAQALGKSADRVFIMAYDFSKSRGDPGPNFPLDDKKTYGYDLKTMTEDFLKVVPRSKLTIVLGMFGYDWITDEKGRGVGSASSKTTLQMENFLINCIDKGTCTESSNLSTGTKITYVMDDENHVVWYENAESAQKKKDYLNSMGLHSVGYWAYSYF